MQGGQRVVVQVLQEFLENELFAQQFPWGKLIGRRGASDGLFLHRLFRWQEV